ncbi:MAG: hypothetical protein ACJ71E_06550 [Nitrososphaeraceae archaeon]
MIKVGFLAAQSNDVSSRLNVEKLQVLSNGGQKDIIHRLQK